MAPLRQSETSNRLLRALTTDDFAMLAPNLVRVDTQVRDDLVIANHPVAKCFFPESGLASVVASHIGKEIEVGMIGSEGMVGAVPLLLYEDRTPHATYIQGSGRMFSIAASTLLDRVEKSPGLRRLLLRYVQTHLIQVTQTAHAQASLGLEGRMASNVSRSRRWRRDPSHP